MYAAALSVKWQGQAGSISYCEGCGFEHIPRGQLLVDSERICMYASDGDMHCLSSDGVALWTGTAEPNGETEPGLGAGLLVLGKGDDQVVALDAGTGMKRWSADLYLPPGFAFAGDSVIAVSGQGDLVALDADTGSVRWSASVGEKPGRPATDGGRVYVSTTEGLEALDAETGRPLFAVAENETFSTPVVSEDVVFFQPIEGGVIAASDGRKLWQKKGLGGWGRRFVAGQGQLYAYRTRTFLALDDRTGKQRWILRDAKPRFWWRPPLVIGPYVVMWAQLPPPDGTPKRRGVGRARRHER